VVLLRHLVTLHAPPTLVAHYVAFRDGRHRHHPHVIRHATAVDGRQEAERLHSAAACPCLAPIHPASPATCGRIRWPGRRHSAAGHVSRRRSSRSAPRRAGRPCARCGVVGDHLDQAAGLALGVDRVGRWGGAAPATVTRPPVVVVLPDSLALGGWTAWSWASLSRPRAPSVMPIMPGPAGQALAGLIRVFSTDAEVRSGPRAHRGARRAVRAAAEGAVRSCDEAVGEAGGQDDGRGHGHRCPDQRAAGRSPSIGSWSAHTVERRFHRGHPVAPATANARKVVAPPLELSRHESGAAPACRRGARSPFQSGRAGAAR